MEKDLPYSWIGRNSSVKIIKQLKVIYRFNAILIQVPMPFFAEIKKINIKMHIEDAYRNLKK
jgi:hypothetical protein